MGLSICCTGTSERAEHLRLQLLSLARCELPFDVEFVFADDSGDDLIEKILEVLVLPFPVTYLRYTSLHPWSNSPYHCPSFGLNLAIKHAKYDAILKVDPETYWVGPVLSNIPKLFHPDRVVVGVQFELSEEVTQRLIEGDEPEVLEGKAKTNSPLLLFSKRRFLLVGGYDEEFMRGSGFEDDELVMRLAKSGAQVLEVPAFRAFHLWHETKRSYLLFHLNEERFRKKVEMLKRGGSWVANQDHVWGDPSAILKHKVFGAFVDQRWERLKRSAREAE